MHQRNAVWQLVEKEFSSLAIVVDVRGPDNENGAKTETGDGRVKRARPSAWGTGCHAPEIEQTLAELFCGFREKFGRDPRTNDPVFFDPHADEPAPLPEEARNQMWERLADAMVCQGEMTAETAYAMKKTGLLVTEQTEHLLSQAQRDAWRSALEDFRGTTRNKLRMPGVRLNNEARAKSGRRNHRSR